MSMSIIFEAHLSFGTKLGLTCSRKSKFQILSTFEISKIELFIKLIMLIIIDIGAIFDFGTKLGLTGGTRLIVVLGIFV